MNCCASRSASESDRLLLAQAHQPLVGHDADNDIGVLFLGVVPDMVRQRRIGSARLSFQGTNTFIVSIAVIFMRSLLRVLPP